MTSQFPGAAQANATASAAAAARATWNIAADLWRQIVLPAITTWQREGGEPPSFDPSYELNCIGYHRLDHTAKTAVIDMLRDNLTALNWTIREVPGDYSSGSTWHLQAPVAPPQPPLPTS